MGLLSGTRAVVTGIANKRSMAWGIAKAFDREDAVLILTYQNTRLKENLDKLLPELSQEPLVLPLDVAEEGFMDGRPPFIAQKPSLKWRADNAFATSSQLGGSGRFVSHVANCPWSGPSRKISGRSSHHVA